MQDGQHQLPAPQARETRKVQRFFKEYWSLDGEKRVSQNTLYEYPENF